ncbi:ACP S-malonyltransferase [Saccharopolyspora sp. NPDC000359]|uniref:ACP S-malonyltransferase n=1 Tax=Saccharopolyspora sp. NPDC000359 TaxID=3154251 RepID=UPI003317E9A1
MTSQLVFLFSGQGSQYHQMGRWLYEHDEVFRGVLDDLDAVVQRERGDSVVAHVYHPEHRLHDPFEDFRHSQPALFMVQYALSRTLAARGVEPDVVLGASLGEVVASAVAGAVDPADCLALLLRQVDLFQRVCPPGGMLAVLADPELFHTDPVLHRRGELAAVNSASNFVVAGFPDDLDRMAAHLDGEGVLHQRLPVPFAFHSAHIDPAEAEFKAAVSRLAPRAHRTRLLSATSGQDVHRPDADHLWRVLRDPFHLDRPVEQLLREGGYRFLDLGPSGSMANLIRSRLPAGAALPLLSPFAKDGTLLDKALASTGTTRPPTTETRRMDTRKLSVHVFPGQGSQFKGMGRELFDRFPELTARADEILGYSIRTLCLEDPDRQLKQTEYTQPALFVVNALAHLAALQEGGRLPDYVLGHSLGEFNALFAAGVFDFDTGLRLVRRRGELMSRASGGTMAAVSGCDVDAVREVLGRHGLDTIDVANINTPTQTVIAGPKDAVDRARPLFAEVGARCVPLNVSAPFHSRYMAAAAAEFGRFLDEFAFAAPKVPVIANVDARPYGVGDVAAKLRQQIASPVRWTDSVRYVMAQGELDVRELGPGTVLTKLVAKIQAEPLPPADHVDTGDTPPTATAAPVVRDSPVPAAESLGSAEFRQAYGVGHAYVAGGMHRGISSPDLVVRMARAGFLAFLGTSGLPVDEVAAAVKTTRDLLRGGEPFGVNLSYDPFAGHAEDELVDALLSAEVTNLEVSGYVQVTSALVRYRLRGSRVRPDGTVVAPRNLLAKVTRPDITRVFLEPPPADLVARLLADGAITREEADAARVLPVASDVCAVGDSGGYTDMGVLPALLPSVLRLRDEIAGRGPGPRVRVGAGGGIGTPEAAAAAFVLGADFVLTGSVNLATRQSAISDRVKDLLQGLDVHDTTYAPFGDLFELGGRARVLKKGVLFHARANKLYDLWRNHDDWQQVPVAVREQVEQKYLHATFEEVYREVRGRDPLGAPEPDPKRRMALVFRWYCERALSFALTGESSREVDFQVCCGPALGACNQWLRGTDLEPWRGRDVDEVARRIMAGAAEVVGRGTARS